MDNNSLTHYGILGMRWGVRRSKAQLRRARGPNSGPRKVSKEVYEAEKAKAINSGNIKKVQAWQSKLTKNELREAIDRCKMDQELKQVSKDQISNGRKVVKTVADDLGTAVKIVAGATGLYNGVVAINNTFNKNHKAPTIKNGQPKTNSNNNNNP